MGGKTFKGTVLSSAVQLIVLRESLNLVPVTTSAARKPPAKGKDALRFELHS